MATPAAVRVWPRQAAILFSLSSSDFNVFVFLPEIRSGSVFLAGCRQLAGSLLAPAGSLPALAAELPTLAAGLPALTGAFWGQ